MLALLLVFGLFAGPVLAWVGYGFLQEGRASMQWPQVPGTIMASVTEQNMTSQRGAQGSVRTWAPDISYHYTVDGVTYQGDRVRVVMVERGRELAQSWAEKYPVGAQVIVSYNPHNPREAVLEPGVPWWVYAGTAIGMLMVLAVVMRMVIKRP